MTLNKSGNIWAKAKKTTKKGLTKFKKTAVTSAASTKKWAIGVEKKLTPQQRFLGKKLPKALWKTAKWAWKAPISAAAIVAAPMIVKSVGEKLPRMKFPSGKEWTKKGRWYV